MVKERLGARNELKPRSLISQRPSKSLEAMQVLRIAPAGMIRSEADAGCSFDNCWPKVLMITRGKFELKPAKPESRMVKVCETLSLRASPDSKATARTNVVLLMAIGPVYSWDAVVGSEPSNV